MSQDSHCASCCPSLLLLIIFHSQYLAFHLDGKLHQTRCHHAFLPNICKDLYPRLLLIYRSTNMCEETHEHPLQARLKDTKHVSYSISVFKVKREREEDKGHHVMKVQISKKAFYNQRREQYILKDSQSSDPQTSKC